MTFNVQLPNTNAGMIPLKTGHAAIIKPNQLVTMQLRMIAGTKTIKVTAAALGFLAITQLKMIALIISLDNGNVVRTPLNKLIMKIRIGSTESFCFRTETQISMPKLSSWLVHWQT